MTSIDPSQKHVLIVDDIEDNRIILERALTGGGYLTTSLTSGQAALSYLSQSKTDIILLDWMMPGLSGYETLKAIREIYSPARLPVIMCTAVGEEANIVEAMAAGANDYVVKPYSLPILRARMAAHLAQSESVSAIDREREDAQRRLTERTRQMFSLPR